MLITQRAGRQSQRREASPLTKTMRVTLANWHGQVGEANQAREGGKEGRLAFVEWMDAVSEFGQCRHTGRKTGVRPDSRCTFFSSKAPACRTLRKPLPRSLSHGLSARFHAQKADRIGDCDRGRFWTSTTATVSGHAARARSARGQKT